MAAIVNADQPPVDVDGPQLGLIVKMPAAATVELAGYVGFNFVLIDTEHGPSDMAELEHHIRAADCAGIRAFVRVSNVASPDILRALDAGARGIVVPHVTSAADVRQAAALTRYPPEGRRSLALSTRVGHHGTRPVDDHLEAAREVALVVQLEDAEALENIPEILGADGLTAAFIGPADLSISLGRPGQLDHPVVSEAVDRIVDAVLGQDELALCALAADEHEACVWIERGARMVLVNAPALMAGTLTRIADAVHSHSTVDTRTTPQYER